MNTVRFLLSYDPSQLFLSLESPSERVRRRPSELRASSLAVRFRRRRAFASLGLRSVALATRFRWLLDASLSGLLWLTDSDGLSASGTRRPHPACGGVCHGSASLHGTPPCFGRYEKGGRFPVPLRVLIPTLPIRAQRFRACWNPTTSRPRSPASRRTAPTGCARPRPERQLHRDGEQEFPSASGHRRG